MKKKKLTQIKNKIREKDKPIELKKVERETNLNELELKLYNKIVEDLSKLNYFTSRRNNYLSDEIYSYKNNIIIDSEGNILQPYVFNLTEEEKKVLKEGVKKIIEKEKKEIIKYILK